MSQTVVRPDAEFQAFLEAGRFMLQKSAQTGRCFFYPRVAEPVTGCTDVGWVEASGRGTIYSSTVVRAKPPAPSYNVVLVDLEEGPRMMSRVEGIPPDAVKIGMKVRARVSRVEGVPCVVFDPVADA